MFKKTRTSPHLRRFNNENYCSMLTTTVSSGQFHLPISSLPVSLAKKLHQTKKVAHVIHFLQQGIKTRIDPTDFN